MKERRLEILGILCMAVSVLILVSLIGFNPNEDPDISPMVQITNPMGRIGVLIAFFFFKLTFGYASILFPVMGIAWGWRFFSGEKESALPRISAYLSGAIILASLTTGAMTLYLSAEGHVDFIYAGRVGGTIAQLLNDFLGLPGTVLTLLASWLILVRGYFSWSFYSPFRALKEKISQMREQVIARRADQDKEQVKRYHTQELLAKIDEQKIEETEQLGDPLKEDLEEDLEPVEKEDIPRSDTISKKIKLGEGEIPEEPIDERAMVETDQSAPGESSQEVKPESGEPVHVGKMVTEAEVNIDELKERQKPKRKYQLPMTELLSSGIQVQDGMSREELVDRANFLAQSLATFGVEGKVVNVHPGPVITLFEVEPAEGVRVNKFVQLSDDLARVMEASRVRVIAPIPGKSSVGIEIPNRNPAMVYFKSVINSEKFIKSKIKLTLAIGKTTSGEIATMDLNSMPHLLIAGTTGSGKSVCLNTIICSILYQATPDEVKFVIIDPKKVEMSLYRALHGYHLLTMADIDEPIVTSPENAILALRTLEKEMDRRYNRLADEVVRNIEEYNKRMLSKDEPIMPYIVLLVDELADLMMISAKDVEIPIARLAQLSRAVGIHLVIATQRPSVDVITGVIKANFPSRIAFQVATKIDSRTIIDTSGAEKLIGRGDMLYLGTGSSEPVRLHNAYISLEEIESIMNHITSQPTAEEMVLPSVREASLSDFSVDSGEQDDFFNEAVRLVITHQQGSISLLQRRLKVGYSRAARLIDEMEQAGIVGPFTGSKAREVLVDESYLESLDY